MRLLHPRDDPGHRQCAQRKERRYRTGHRLEDAKARLPLLQLPKDSIGHSPRGEGGGEVKGTMRQREETVKTVKKISSSPVHTPLKQGVNETEPLHEFDTNESVEL